MKYNYKHFCFKHEFRGLHSSRPRTAAVEELSVLYRTEIDLAVVISSWIKARIPLQHAIEGTLL